MKVPFTWKVTGWFMIGWSAEFPVGEVKPLRYFGEDLVAYRDESGELHVLSAHCRHLGAHIGHGGTVVGDCVECPFHGWRWGPDGTNRYIPYQPDRPNRGLKLRVFPVQEQYGCVFAWHQPQGKEPRWEMPDIFKSFPQFEADPSAYYRPYPEFSRRTENEPVHPQIVAENGPDSSHFRYVHGATVTPVCLDWRIVDQQWQFLTGWPDARSGDATSRSTTSLVKSSSGFSRLHQPGLRAAWDFSASHSAPPPLPITTIERASESIAEAREISLTVAS